MGWLFSEWVLIKRPMLRWWLRTGSWILAVATLLFAIKLATILLLVPWLLHVVPGMCHAEAMSSPGPLGLTAKEFDALHDFLDNTIRFICLITWILAAEQAASLRRDIATEQILPYGPLHRQGAYVLAVLQGLVPMCFSVVLPIVGVLILNPHFHDIQGSWVEVWHAPFGFFILNQAVLFLLVPFALTGTARRLAWALITAYVLLPYLAGSYLDLYYFQHGAPLWYQRGPTIAEVTNQLGFSWEVGGLVIFTFLALLATNFQKLAQVWLLPVMIAPIVSTYAEVNFAPPTLTDWYSWSDEVTVKPNQHLLCLLALAQGPASFLNDSLCHLADTQYEIVNRDPVEFRAITVVEFDQPLKWRLALPAWLSFAPTLVNVLWFTLLAVFIITYILPLNELDGRRRSLG